MSDFDDRSNAFERRKPHRKRRQAASAPNSINVTKLCAHFASDIRSGTRTVLDFDRAVRLTRLLDAIDASSDGRCALSP